jgi:arylsulfatase A-like enzyme
MLKSLKGKKQKQADFLYWEYYSGDRSPVQAIRQGDWKLIRFNFLQPEKQEVELYNLASDPEEKNNLVQNNSLLVSRLLSILDKEHSDYKHYISE